MANMAPPNDSFRNGSPGSTGPLARSPSPIPFAPNAVLRNGDPGMGDPHTRTASPIGTTPNAGIFRDGDPGHTPTPTAATEPGKGSIPVDPRRGTGVVNDMPMGLARR